MFLPHSQVPSVLQGWKTTVIGEASANGMFLSVHPYKTIKMYRLISSAVNNRSPIVSIKHFAPTNNVLPLSYHCITLFVPLRPSHHFSNLLVF